MLEDYLPEIKKATKNSKIPFLTQVDMFMMLAGMLPKWLWMFTYEEKMIPVPGALTTPGIWIGATMIPIINFITDSFTGFTQTD